MSCLVAIFKLEFNFIIKYLPRSTTACCYKVPSWRSSVQLTLKPVTKKFHSDHWFIHLTLKSDTHDFVNLKCILTSLKEKFDHSKSEFIFSCLHVRQMVPLMERIKIPHTTATMKSWVLGCSANGYIFLGNGLSLSSINWEIRVLVFSGLYAILHKI